MSKEINDLLEINQAESESHNNEQNVERHLVLRIGIPILLLVILFSLSDNGYLNVILVGCISIVWLISLLIESIMLNFNRKKKLRNANLVIFIIPLFCVLLLIIGLSTYRYGM